MIKRYAILCNLLLFVIGCYVWDDGNGGFWAVGTSAPKGTQFTIYVNTVQTAWFTQLNRRFSAGTVPANGIVRVYANNQLICSN